MGSLKTWCELKIRRTNLSVVAVRTRPGRDKDGIDAVRPGLGREVSQSRRFKIVADYPMDDGEANLEVKSGVLTAFR